MAFEVVNPDQRASPDKGQGLGDLDGDQQSPQESGALGDGDRGDIARLYPGRRKGFRQERQEPFEVFAAGHLRDDPPVACVQIDLTCDQVCPQP